MANDLLDLTRTTQDQFLGAVGALQDTVVEGTAKWAETVARVVPARVGELVPDLPEAPSPAQVLDLSFGFTEKLLASNRAFAQKLLAAATVAPAVSDPIAATAPAGSTKK